MSKNDQNNQSTSARGQRGGGVTATLQLPPHHTGPTAAAAEGGGALHHKRPSLTPRPLSSASAPHLAATLGHSGVGGAPGVDQRSIVEHGSDAGGGGGGGGGHGHHYAASHSTAMGGRHDVVDRDDSCDEMTYPIDQKALFDVKGFTLILDKMLHDELENVAYDRVATRQLCLSLAARILAMTKKHQKLPRYKLVSFVSAGSVRERGSLVAASRCLWNTKTDDFSSAQYRNATLFVAVTVYAIYHE